MAWIYQLAVHCPNKWVAYRMSQKYAGQTFVFSDVPGTLEGGEVCRFYSDAKEVDGEWWVDVVPSGITWSGIANEKEARRADEFCNVMYGMLRNETNFDYAIIGVEVGEFRTLEEMKKDLLDSDINNLHGLVVSCAMTEVPFSALLEPFSSTHRWIPKRSEVQLFAERETC